MMIQQSPLRIYSALLSPEFRCYLAWFFSRFISFVNASEDGRDHQLIVLGVRNSPWRKKAAATWCWYFVIHFRAICKTIWNVVDILLLQSRLTNGRFWDESCPGCPGLSCKCIFEVEVENLWCWTVLSLWRIPSLRRSSSQTSLRKASFFWSFMRWIALWPILSANVDEPFGKLVLSKKTFLRSTYQMKNYFWRINRTFSINLLQIIGEEPEIFTHWPLLVTYFIAELTGYQTIIDKRLSC